MNIRGTSSTDNKELLNNTWTIFCRKTHI